MTTLAHHLTKRLKLLFSFKGRASRQEFWFINVACGAWIAVFFSVLPKCLFESNASEIQCAAVEPLFVVFLVMPIVPLFAVATRRQHDVGWIYANPSVLAFLPVSLASIIDISIKAVGAAEPVAVLKMDGYEPSWFVVISSYVSWLLYAALNSLPSQAGYNYHGPNPSEPDK